MMGSGNFFAVSAGVSFLSLIKGPITYIKSKKCGQLGIVGQAILAPFFVAGTAARVAYVYFFFPLFADGEIQIIYEFSSEIGFDVGWVELYLFIVPAILLVVCVHNHTNAIDH